MSISFFKLFEEEPPVELKIVKDYGSFVVVEIVKPEEEKNERRRSVKKAS